MKDVSYTHAPILQHTGQPRVRSNGAVLTQEYGHSQAAHGNQRDHGVWRHIPATPRVVVPNLRATTT